MFFNLNRENSQREEDPERVAPAPNPNLNSSLKMRPNQSSKPNQNQPQNQFNNHPLISPPPRLNNQLKKSQETSLSTSQLATSRESTPLQTTSHQLPRTLLKVDMLVFSSPPPPKLRLCTPSSRTSPTSSNFSITPNPSDSSPKIKVSVPRRLDNSTQLYKALVISTH